MFIDAPREEVTGYIGSGAGNSWVSNNPIYLEEGSGIYNVYNYGFYDADQQAFACSTSGLNEDIPGKETRIMLGLIN